MGVLRGTIKLIAISAVFIGFLTSTAVAGFIYDVNRVWTNASLVGTVDVDLGNYAIMNAGSHPFNATDLTLTVGATSYSVGNVLTDIIFGSGVFNITATTTELIFNPSGDGGNPADLVISDGGANQYIIGSNGTPAFEVAYTGAGNSISNPGPVFPLVWGTASDTSPVPEPSTLALLGLGLAGLGIVARRKLRK